MLRETSTKCSCDMVLLPAEPVEAATWIPSVLRVDGLFSVFLLCGVLQVLIMLEVASNFLTSRPDFASFFEFHRL